MGINYKNIVKDLLKEYVLVKDTMEDTLTRLAYLESSKTNITVQYGKEAIQSTPGKVDDKLISIVAEVELIKKNIKENEKLIEDIENSMKHLTPMEKDITIKLFGSQNRNHNADDLAAKYNYERPSIYRIANNSITKMSYVLYGKG